MKFTGMLSAAAAPGPCIELYGGGEMIVDPCEWVIGYDENDIELIGGGKKITVTGRGLVLTALTPKSVNIRGEIESVVFSGGGQ